MTVPLRLVEHYELRRLLRPSHGWNVAVWLAVFLAQATYGGERFDAAKVEFFEKKIRPLLAQNCYNCHSANTNSQGGLRVDDRNGLLNGGNRGPAVIPGDPEKSRLMQAVLRTNDKLKMPPEQGLTADEVADLRKWIADGAAWPQVEAPSDLGKPNPEYEKLRKEHWAWQPLAPAEPPLLNDASWPRDDIDRFILARLEAKGLRPVGDASKLNLIRRIAFDLTGLPPVAEDVADFLADESPRALESVVDRLLGSPSFGERWGRHWLDVARYGESTGSARNLPYPNAWRYRDYVIDALNKDKPYDQFLREQIAGDLLPFASPEQQEEQLTATGFLALGVKDVNQRYKVRYVMDNIDEQIDTVTRAVLAVTASCARCHDHKYDPIPTTDYYALAGIFHSTDLCAGLRNKMGGGGLDYYDTSMVLRIGVEKPPPSPEQVAKLTKEVEDAKKAWDAIRGTSEGLALAANGQPKQRPFRLKFERLQAELAELTDPLAGAKVIMGVRDAKKIADTELRVRGEAEKLGPLVPRGFLGILQWPDQTPVSREQSGRLELAEWLTSRHNPLTPRVMVNRVWQHLFGQGLLRSVDNFGVTGDVPSHPELLDHLAARFVAGGWSVKRLVRDLVLTRAYQLDSIAAVENMKVDPANRLVWRHRPRRLAAEEIRDAMLAAAGRLNPARPAASPAKELKVVELRNNGPEANKFHEFARASLHRSVYLPVLRGLTPTSLEIFDFAEQGMVTGSRDTTTVAPQALYMLNDPFVRQQSIALANRIVKQDGLDEPARIQAAYERTFGRPASDKELARCQTYLAEYEAAVRASQETPSSRLDPTASDSSTEETTKPAVSVNPDEPDRTEQPIKDLVAPPRDPRLAAWASLCQALLCSAEFRYLK